VATCAKWRAGDYQRITYTDNYLLPLNPVVIQKLRLQDVLEKDLKKNQKPGNSYHQRVLLKFLVCTKVANVVILIIIGHDMMKSLIEIDHTVSQICATRCLVQPAWFHSWF